MKNIFIISLIISFVFLLFKFIEMRFINKENKSLKPLVRETAFVFISSIVSFFLVEQFTPAIDNLKIDTPNVFVGEPLF